MSESHSVEQLKQLVSQLQAKIERLEKQAGSTVQDAKAKVGESLDSAKDAVKGTLASHATTGGKSARTGFTEQCSPRVLRACSCRDDAELNPHVQAQLAPRHSRH